MMARGWVAAIRPAGLDRWGEGKARRQALLWRGFFLLWIAGVVLMGCLLRGQLGAGERLLEEGRIKRALAGHPRIVSQAAGLSDGRNKGPAGHDAGR